MLKYGIFLHPSVGCRSPGQNTGGSLAAPTESLADAQTVLVLLSGTKLLSLDIQREFFWKCRAKQQAAEGLGGHQGKAGGCLLQHLASATIVNLQQGLQLNISSCGQPPLSHPAPVTTFGCCIFPVQCDKINARDAVHLLTQKLNFWGMLSNPCKCPKSVDFR